jgi:hypothetical protein
MLRNDQKFYVDNVQYILAKLNPNCVERPLSQFNPSLKMVNVCVVPFAFAPFATNFFSSPWICAGSGAMFPSPFSPSMRAKTFPVSQSICRIRSALHFLKKKTFFLALFAVTLHVRSFSHGHSSCCYFVFLLMALQALPQRQEDAAAI